jgi:precorrin-2 dehydrogenase/sirohydrochlorin ferrochelatase
LSVVVGGGSVAERKVRGILAAAGQVRVVSPDLTAALLLLAEQGLVEWRQKSYSGDDLDGAYLVFAATNSSAAQEAVCRDARAAGVLLNVADGPELCDFQTPSVVRRGDLTLSVATNGRSPAVAAMVRRRLERDFGDEYRLLTALVGRLREQILREAGSDADKKILFQKILCDDIVDWLRERQWERIQRRLEQVLGRPVGQDLESLIKENP